MFLLALAIEQAVFMETRHSEFEKMMRNVCLNGACDRLAICLKIRKFRKICFIVQYSCMIIRKNINLLSDA